MLKLIIGEEGKTQSATVPVRWCVDKETLENLVKIIEVLNPHILLVVVSDKKEISRQLAPLDQLVEYIQFQRPGANKVFATIVWSDKKTEKERKKNLWNRFLKKDDGDYSTTLIYNGEFEKELLKSIEFAEVEVVIPKELFAKEPPAWEKRWVNMWFETRPKDQCQYRRRRILAYTIQPPIVLFWLIFAKIIPRLVVAVIFLILGFWFDFEDKKTKNFTWNPKKWKPILNLKPIFHPWNYGFEDLFSKEFKDFADGAGPLIIAASAYIIIIVITIYLFISGLRWLLNFVLKPIKPVIKAIYAATLQRFFGFSDKMISKIIKRMSQNHKEATQTTIDKMFREKASAILQEYDRKNYQDILVCQEGLSANLSSLPKEKKTIHLRYMDLKSKVCKPMQR